MKTLNYDTECIKESFWMFLNCLYIKLFRRSSQFLSSRSFCAMINKSVIIKDTERCSDVGENKHAVGS